MNKVILLGRLTADTELRTTPNNLYVTSFTIAVNRRTQGEQTADFIRCIAWRHTAEFIGKYFHKGDMIAVVGSIQTGSYTDKDGNKRYATDVVVNEAYFAGNKRSDNNGYNTVNGHSTINTPQVTDEFTEIPPNEFEDLPF